MIYYLIEQNEERIEKEMKKKENLNEELTVNSDNLGISEEVEELIYQHCSHTYLGTEDHDFHIAYTDDIRRELDCDYDEVSDILDKLYGND